MNKPWLAALLNVIPLGIGYIYLRRWKRFVATFVGGLIAAYAGLFLAVESIEDCIGLVSSPCGGTFLGALVLFLSLPGAVAGFTTRDAWRLAQKHSRLAG